jgi:hypothetical protein
MDYACGISRMESYKIALGTITKALGRITDFLVKVGNIQCNIILLIINTNNNDVLLGLNFLMKIRAMGPFMIGVPKMSV